MATYDEIYANTDWFRKQAGHVSQRVGECLNAASRINCMYVSEWPVDLSSFRDQYEMLLIDMAGSTDIGYQTGSERLIALSEGLIDTAKSYVEAEAESEETIRQQVLELLKDF